MATLTVQDVQTFKDYLGYVEDLREARRSVVWYRGCGRSTYKLIPSLFRRKQCTKIEDFMNLEKKLISWFKQRSIPFHSRSLNNPWEWLFFMQHYGVPTRLLDWTESPLMGLFFAITSTPHTLDNTGKPVFSSDAAVWVLDPVQWNKRSVDLKSFEERILTPEDTHLGAYSPEVDCNIMKDFPIALYGAHNSQRIVAQRGVFVVFGKQVKPMELIYEKESFPSGSLRKLTISKKKLPLFYEAIHRHGISDSVAFPDLDGLAREMKRIFKFEV